VPGGLLTRGRGERVSLVLGYTLGTRRYCVMRLMIVGTAAWLLCPLKRERWLLLCRRRPGACWSEIRGLPNAAMGTMGLYLATEVPRWRHDWTIFVEGRDAPGKCDGRHPVPCSETKTIISGIRTSVGRNSYRMNMVPQTSTVVISVVEIQCHQRSVKLG